MSCSQPPVKEQGPRPVKLEEVTSLDMVEKSFSGVVSPDQFSDLAFKMSGPLISLNVEEGQKVRTGQIVAEIDPQEDVYKRQIICCVQWLLPGIIRERSM